jgi:heme iron utilization protein
MAYNKGLDVIQSLLVRQKFAVICSLSDGQPYSNLVAFAETPDLRNLVFATSRDTAKYQNLLRDRRVSLLIDNRTNLPADFETAKALTALGKAFEIETDADQGHKELFLAKHANLAYFLNDKRTSLFLVKVSTYVLAGFEIAERMDFDNI